MEHFNLIFSKVPTLRFPEFAGEWQDTTLGNVCVYRKTRRTAEKKNYISTENILQNYQGAERFTSNESISGDGFNKNDILMGNIRPYLKKVYYADFDGVCNADVLVFKSNLINPHFLYCRLANDTFINYVMKSVKGSKMPRGDKSHIMQYPLSIPGEAEQSKISNFVELLTSRIQVQNKIISKYETLIKGIYHEFFSKPADYAIKIKDLIIKGKSGGTPSSTVARYYNGDIPFLSISDMTKQGKYVSYTEKHISKSGIENSSAWIVPSNSLIFSMYASVGLVCINTVPLATSQAMFSMVLKDRRMIEYIYYYLNFFRETKIHRHIETGTQSNINAETVRNIDIPFQSNHLKLVETLNSIEKRLNNEKDMLSLLLDLKAYLLSKLFI